MNLVIEKLMVRLVRGAEPLPGVAIIIVVILILLLVIGITVGKLASLNVKIWFKDEFGEREVNGKACFARVGGGGGRASNWGECPSCPSPVNIVSQFKVSECSAIE